MTAGFVVGGAGVSGLKPVLVRSTGPTLAAFDLSGTLPDPKLTLNYTSASPVEIIDSDTGWGGNPSIAAESALLGAFSWGSQPTADSALLESLSPGNYTAQVAGASGDSGLALVEVYDATPSNSYTSSTPRLVNLSVLGPVGTGANILIVGFVVGGNTAKTVLLRASGPALATDFSIAGAISDPVLTLTDTTQGSSKVLRVNAGWAGDSTLNSVAAGVGAFPWALSSQDSAILVTLPPGNYTASVSGAAGDTGLALIEVYEVD